MMLAIDQRRLTIGPQGKAVNVEARAVPLFAAIIRNLRTASCWLNVHPFEPKIPGAGPVSNPESDEASALMRNDFATKWPKAA
jgi:hypothetical protein